LEEVYVILINGIKLTVFLITESINDNRNNDVQKDLANDKLEAQEVKSGSQRISAPLRLAPVGLDLLIGLVVNALEQDVILPPSLVHELEPRLTRRNSEQQEESIPERLEVGVDAQAILQHYV
jgi:hypothetical protein